MGEVEAMRVRGPERSEVHSVEIGRFKIIRLIDCAREQRGRWQLREGGPFSSSTFDLTTLLTIHS